MDQSKLDRAVARATGESPQTIHRMGFSIADPESVRYDPEPSGRAPLVVDWDALDARRQRRAS
jgi:hypothetical protein